MLASNKTIRYVQFVTVFAFVLFLISCVYVPSSSILSKEPLATIKVGTTTKDEIIQQLGEPFILKEKQFFVYEKIRDPGSIIFVYPDVGAITLKTNYHRILMEFNGNDVVKRCEIESGKGIIAGVLGEGVMPIRKSKTKHTCLRTVFEERSKFGYGPIFDSVAFSSDGKMLAAGDHRSRVWLKDLQTGKVVKFKGKKHLSKIKSVEFSSDNKTLAVGGIDKIARVWDVVTGKEVVTFEGHGKSGIWTGKPQLVTSLAFAPNGKAVATGGRQGKVIIWNPKTGHEIMIIQAHKSIVSSIAFSPDGNLLATTGWLDSNVKLWSLPTGNELATVSLQDYLNDYISVTFSPNGSMFAIASAKHVKLWKIVRNKSKVEPESLNPLGDLLAVFILPYFDTIMPLETSVAFSPDGRMIAASNGGAAIWDISTSQRLWRLVPYEQTHIGWKDAVYDLAFSPDGKTFAAAFCDSLCLFNVP